MFSVVDFGFTSHPPTSSKYFYRDVNEYHVGGEWKWLHSGHVLAIRAGLFTDPPHGLRYQVDDKQTVGVVVENFEFNVDARTDTRLGKTAGLGWAWGESWQVDAAVSFVNGDNNGVVSLAYRRR
jgi:hypothetical protein